MLACPYTILFTASLIKSINMHEDYMDELFWDRFLPWRRKIKVKSNLSQIKFVPKLRITRRDDWVYLEIYLWNRSGWTVWVEEATVVLADLHADLQTEVPTGQVNHKIRQNIVPGDALSVSLAAAIYDAAGRPQGQYSCLVLTDVSYRVLNEWRNAKLERYRVEMAAVTVVRLRSTHRYNKKIKQMNGSVYLTTKERKG